MEKKKAYKLSVFVSIERTTCKPPEEFNHYRRWDEPQPPEAILKVKSLVKAQYKVNIKC